jgi:hypothetical protein
MNTNETKLLNAMLVVAANVSPEKLREYANIMEMSPDVRSDNRFSDADILRTAQGLLRAYRDKHVQEIPAEGAQPFRRRFMPALELLDECLEYYSPKKD